MKMLGFVPLQFWGGPLGAGNRRGDLLDPPTCHWLPDATWIVWC
jgi:hypothetical protein